MNCTGINWKKHLGEGTAAIILGMGPQALFLLRELKDYYPEVNLIGKKNWISYLSRYGKKVIVDESGVKNAVETILKRHSREIPVLISGGNTLRYYLKSEYLQTLNCFPKPLASLKVLNDKRIFYEYLENKCISCNLIRIIPFEEESVNSFPLILKWRFEPDFSTFKTLLLRDENDYLTAKKKYGKYKDKLLLQHYIKDKNSLSYAALSDNGDTSRELTVHLDRRGTDGLASKISSYNGKQRDKMVSICRELIKKFHYTGLIEFDFIEDKKSEILYLLECNPRPWGWIDFLKHSVIPQQDKTMINILRDVTYIYKEKRKVLSLISPRKTLRYLSYNKSIWSINDPFPFFGQFLNGIGRLRNE